MGGGEKPQTYLKGSGRYVSPVIAYGGSLAWFAIVNWVLYPIMSNMVENFFASLDPRYNAPALLVMGLIGYSVFKQRRVT